MKLSLVIAAAFALLSSSAVMAGTDKQYLFDLSDQVVLAEVVDVGEVQVEGTTYVGATVSITGVVKGDYSLAIAIALLPGPGISFREGPQELSVGSRGMFLLGRRHEYKKQPIAMAMLRFIPESELSDKASKNQLLAMAVASKIKTGLTTLAPMTKSESRALRVPGAGSCVVQLGFKNGFLELADIKTSSGDKRFDQQLQQAAYASLAGVDTLLDGLVELSFENGEP